MRPLFSKAFMRELQVVPTVLSTDQINPPDVVAMVAASAAVHISDIPVRRTGRCGANVCLVEGEMSLTQRLIKSLARRWRSSLPEPKTVSRWLKAVAKKYPKTMLHAIDTAREVIQEICRVQEETSRSSWQRKAALGGGRNGSLSVADEMPQRMPRQSLKKRVS